MTNYPVHVFSHGLASSGTQNIWRSDVPSFDPLDISIPREFDGPNLSFSPEDLFSMALVNCFIATFKVVAERSRIDFTSLEGNCDLTIDHANHDNGRVQLTKANFKFVLSGVSNPTRARRLLEQVSTQCILINSVKVQPSFEFEIV